MQTFERAYKSILKSLLEKYIDKTVIVSNDINYKPLEKDSDALVAIIKTGPGLKQNNPYSDLTSLTFNISIIINANDAQSVLGAIGNLILNNNAIWGTLTIPFYDDVSDELVDTDVSYLPIFFTTPSC